MLAESDEKNDIPADYSEYAEQLGDQPASGLDWGAVKAEKKKQQELSTRRHISEYLAKHSKESTDNYRRNCKKDKPTMAQKFSWILTYSSCRVAAGAALSSLLLKGGVSGLVRCQLLAGEHTVLTAADFTMIAGKAAYAKKMQFERVQPYVTLTDPCRKKYPYIRLDYLPNAKEIAELLRAKGLPLNTVVLVKAPMGMGKTQYLGLSLRDECEQDGSTFIATAYSQSLSKELCEKLRCQHYVDDIDTAALSGKGYALGVCLASLSKEQFAALVREEATIFIDEVSQGIAFLSKEICKNNTHNANDNARIFFESLKNARRVVGVDAGLNDVTIEAIALYTGRPPLIIEVVPPEPTPLREINWCNTGHQSKSAATMEAIAWEIAEGLRKDEVYYLACDYKANATLMRDLLLTFKVNPDDILLLTRDNKGAEDGKDTTESARSKAFYADADGETRKCKVVITSPVVGSGISITHKGAPHFTKVIGIFGGGTITPESICQMLYRVRYVSKMDIYYGDAYAEPKEEKEQKIINQLLQEQAITCTEIAKLTGRILYGEALSKNLGEIGLAVAIARQHGCRSNCHIDLVKFINRKIPYPADDSAEFAPALIKQRQAFAESVITSEKAAEADELRELEINRTGYDVTLKIESQKFMAFTGMKAITAAVHEFAFGKRDTFSRTKINRLAALLTKSKDFANIRTSTGEGSQLMVAISAAYRHIFQDTDVFTTSRLTPADCDELADRMCWVGIERLIALGMLPRSSRRYAKKNTALVRDLLGNAGLKVIIGEPVAINTGLNSCHKITRHIGYIYTQCDFVAENSGIKGKTGLTEEKSSLMGCGFAEEENPRPRFKPLSRNRWRIYTIEAMGTAHEIAGYRAELMDGVVSKVPVLDALAVCGAARDAIAKAAASLPLPLVKALEVITDTDDAKHLKKSCKAVPVELQPVAAGIYVALWGDGSSIPRNAANTFIRHLASG